MDAIGGEIGLSNVVVEINIQTVEALDLERKGNLTEKVIHMMWKRRVRNRTWTVGGSNVIVRRSWAGGLRPAPARMTLGDITAKQGAFAAAIGAAIDEETALANSFFTLFKTWLSGEKVGEDQYGNRYFREKRPAAGRRERRWVVYSGEAEPTRVPPGWVGWLHGRIEEPPSETPLPSPHFEKEPMPNLTGTAEAYLPPGAVQRGGSRAAATGDYEAWRP